jgi:zinc D-Ala-D-Ala dipeptidase
MQVSPFTLPCEQVAQHPDYRSLESIRGISVDLRYGSPNNFVNKDVYAPLDCRWLHKDAAGALERTVEWLTLHAPAVRLLVLDALRPQRAHEVLYAAVKGTEFNLYLAEPTRGSIHSFGMAVDVTLTNLSGVELDMGTPFDDFSELSHPARESAWLDAGTLTRAQVESRQLLRNAMAHGGFKGINTEWWHFDCGDRLTVRAEFARVL